VTALGPGAGDTLRPPWPTFAEPLGFAPPVEVRDEESGFTLAFDVAPRTEEDLEVEVDGQTLYLFGAVWAGPPCGRPHRLWRAFALPAGLDPGTARLRLEGRLLEVSLGKTSARRSIAVQGR
jgi:HSP20 family molecular chaperone IbpA